MGEGREAEQRGTLGPEPHHLGDDGAVVVLALVLAARREGRESLLAQVAAARVAQERVDQRPAERDDVLARQAALRRRLGRGVAQGRRQACQVLLAVEHEQEALLVAEDVLPEARAELGQPFGDGAEPRPVGVAEAGAIADEVPVGDVEHAALLGIEAERIAALEHGVDAGEELGVECDALPVAGEDRRHVALDLLQAVVGVGAGEVPEHAADAAQLSSGPFEGRDHVVERGLVRRSRRSRRSRPGARRWRARKPARNAPARCCRREAPRRASSRSRRTDYRTWSSPSWLAEGGRRGDGLG